MYRWDLFISHASEDKQDFVCPLANVLIEKGLRVWYDDFSLYPGDLLRKSIDEGISLSRFGVVVLSEAYFSKKWPQAELEGLFAREDHRNKVLIPIFHNITPSEVRKHSPMLSSRVGIMSNKGLEYVVNQILEVVKDVTASLTPAGRLVDFSAPSLEAYEWTPKAVRIGLATGLLCERSGNIYFSEKYVKNLCVESKKTTKNVKSFFDEDWPDFILLSAAKAAKRRSIASEDEFDYLVSHLSRALMSYLHPIAFSAKLISQGKGEEMDLGDGVWDAFHDALAVRMIKLHERKSKNIQLAIMEVCIDIVKSHLLLYRKEALDHSHLLAMYFFIILSVLGHIEEIEQTFSQLLVEIDEEEA